MVGNPVLRWLLCASCAALIAAGAVACGEADGRDTDSAPGALEAEPRVAVGARAPVVPVAAPAPEPPPPLPPLVVDLHVDTITAMMERGLAWDSRDLEASLPELREAGINVVVQAAWIPRNDPNPRGTAVGKLKRIRAMVQASRGAAAIVTGPDQLERVVRDGRLAVLVALEGGTGLTDGTNTLDELRGLGLSMVGLTWTESSPYADSSAEPRKGSAGGLTEAGRALVAAANDRGVLIDVSHMSDQATADTVAASRAPVLASHSNARALCDVPRNLPDSLLQAIADKGGLVGVMFHGPFVVSGRKAERRDVVAQVQGLVERLGADHVGLGSDWDGKIQSPVGLTGSEHFPQLRSDLGAVGLDDGQLRSVMGDSLLRLWRAAWAVRATGSGQGQGPEQGPEQGQEQPATGG